MTTLTTIGHLATSDCQINFHQQKITAHFGEVNIGVPFFVLAEFIQHCDDILWGLVARGLVVEWNLETIVFTDEDETFGIFRAVYTSNEFGLRFHRETDKGLQFDDRPLGFPLSWISEAMKAIDQHLNPF